MEKIFYFKENDELFNKEDYQVITELEKKYFEMSSYQNLLTNIIQSNSNNLEHYNFYFEKYVEAFEKYEEQKTIFSKQIVNKICPKSNSWYIDFFNKEIKVTINE